MHTRKTASHYVYGALVGAWGGWAIAHGWTSPALTLTLGAGTALTLLLALYRTLGRRRAMRRFYTWTPHA